jgi:hypothetical protein
MCLLDLEPQHWENEDFERHELPDPIGCSKRTLDHEKIDSPTIPARYFDWSPASDSASTDK